MIFFKIRLILVEYFVALAAGYLLKLYFFVHMFSCRPDCYFVHRLVD